MAKYKHQYVSIYNEYNLWKSPKELEELVSTFCDDIIKIIDKLNLDPAEVEQFVKETLYGKIMPYIVLNALNLQIEEKKIGVKK